MQYQLKRVNYCYITYNSDFEKTNGICELCKQPLTTAPNTVQQTSPVEQPQKDTHKKNIQDYLHNIVVGKCGHAFHLACMNKIGKISCPIDNTVWTDKYIEKIITK